MTVLSMGTIAGAAGIAPNAISKGIRALYRISGDLNEYLDKHIEDMKGSESPTISRTGSVLEAAKRGFGVGYLSSTIIIATGQYLLGNNFAALGTIATAATLTNPVAMTCAAVGAIYYGWNALSDEERTEILERLGQGLAIGIELIKAVVRFVIDRTKELLSTRNIEEFKKFIAAAAEGFGKTLGDVTHRITDVVGDTFDSVKKKSGRAMDRTMDATSETYRTVSDSAGIAAEQIRKKVSASIKKAAPEAAPTQLLTADQELVPANVQAKDGVLGAVEKGAPRVGWRKQRNKDG